MDILDRILNPNHDVPPIAAPLAASDGDDADAAALGSRRQRRQRQRLSVAEQVARLEKRSRFCEKARLGKRIKNCRMRMGP